jgi:signal transduction histidine kinase
MPEISSEKLTAEDLLALSLFEGESVEAAEWIASNMEVRRYKQGEIIVREGSPAREFAIVLEGEMHFRIANSDVTMVAQQGQPTGVLPFSRIKTWPGRSWAAQPLKLAVMESSLLRELVYRAPVLAQRLVAQMTDRTRETTRIEESSNRLLALGKLAAGLAHELNNPASAAVRSSARLRDVLNQRRNFVLALRGEVLPERARQILSEIGDTLPECAASPGSMDALERADLESDLSDWLETAGAPGDLASSLVDARIGIEQLRPLASLIPKEVLTLALQVLVADHEIMCLTRELEEASRRISDIVQAVKTYSYMDQSPVAEVDVERGIDVTLRMFQHQLKHGVQVRRQFAGDLPQIHANGSALNQVWTNLIDNSLHAVEAKPAGEAKVLTIRTCAEPDCILVEIGDNGAGIPEDVQRRIFEPFYTTKRVGEGTGLGLDIVQRIVRGHRGSIRVESEPGRTVFQVRLPVNQE